MKYRQLSPTGDYQFGRSGIFHISTPQGVAQAVLTRLKLWTGEWFLDVDEGTPYEGRILGHGTHGTRDAVLKQRIVGTPGVRSLLEYVSSVDAQRRMTVQARVDTEFGQAIITFEA